MSWKRQKKAEHSRGRQRVITVTGTLETRITIDSPDVFQDKLSPEARARLAAREKTTAAVLKFARDDPEAASQLLRVWLAGQPEKSSQ